MIPTLVGHVDGYGTGTVDRTLTPHASTADGDLLVAVFGVNAQTITAPAGWTAVKSAVNTGTLRTYVFAKYRVAGETDYVFTIGASATDTHSIISFSGVDATIGNLVIGADGIRGTNATSTTTKAPGITTTVADCRVVTVSLDRSTASEANIVSVSPGTADFFVAQNGGVGLETISVSHVDQLSAGATADVVTTYPNSQSVNGYAFQLGLPPVAGSSEFTGSVSLSGAGSLVPAGVPRAVGSLVLSGFGALTGVATPHAVGSVALAGQGALATAGKPNVGAAVALSASGTFATSGIPNSGDAIGLSAAGSLVAVGVPSPVGAVALSGSGLLTMSGKPSTVGQLGLSAVGLLAGFADGFAGVVGFTATGSLAVNGRPSVAGSASLGGDGALSVSAVPSFTVAVALSGSGFLGVTPAFVVSLSADGVLTTTGIVHVLGQVELSAEGLLASESERLNISAAGSLGERAWSASLSARGKSGAIELRTRSGVLAIRSSTGNVESRRWGGTLV